MPYTVTKSSSGKYIVKKKDSGKVVATTDSAKNLRGVLWHREHPEGEGGGQEIGGTFTEGRGAGGKFHHAPIMPKETSRLVEKYVNTYRDVHGTNAGLSSEKLAKMTEQQLIDAITDLQWKGQEKGKGAGGKKDINIQKRLEHLRKQIRNENISYGEIAELQSLKKYIKPGDVELAEWADIPEHKGRGAGGSDMNNMTYPKIGNDMRDYYSVDFQRRLHGNGEGGGKSSEYEKNFKPHTKKDYGALLKGWKKKEMGKGAGGDEDDNDTGSYKIVRFYAPDLNKRSRVIQTGLSLKEAKAWCNDPKTRKEGKWFDGFSRE